MAFAMFLSFALAIDCKLGHADDNSSIARGGRLFDNWILENKDRLPSKVYPNYKITDPSTHNIERSWRCVSCHGWDHKGNSEQEVGVINKTRISNSTILVTILTDSNHLYDNIFSERDFSDLAAYLRADMIPYLDPGSSIDTTREINLYATICAICHGYGGQKITSMLPLGTFARRYPQETMHKVFNGHPGVWMPPFNFLDASRLSDLFAYIQGLPDKNLSASIARGGRLYDHWQKETNGQPPNSRHPSYPKDSKHAHKPVSNWRCKECHGWDYKGADGAYEKGSHRTGIKGIRAFADSDPEEVIALLMDSNHRYHGTRWHQTPLDLQDLIDLANFVSFGQIEMDDYIDPETGKAKGNANKRKNDFNVLCATCHGEDGKELATGRDIGDVSRDNPWEALHKIRNGHPNEAMPSLLALSMAFLVDILAYAQTLP